MEVVLALAAVALLGLGIGRLLRRRSSPVDEVGGFLAGGVPAVLAHDRQTDLEEGALDPDELDELDDEELVWDEGADDELDA